ncbi:MAG: hypothetical protein A2664_04625 [Candidatus Taylorbacteria bacterium RIFCSPHIGHO2_01_FULL_46_22b]|uniref:Uncharacterized protein n=1 Tax=Candidatus Taylorbacteria bacterium RIFCSPHIGHO2_01_FULL_46_22b TaxID=1802301 RepID=A0A1G2M4M7_9BACT|nr:MAG: hypothetical protein A2664_04625 [Candidatus Taylorbacteria bacterium RIFCSPHIGHO2_01_FULL_46_22b]
MKKKPTPRNIHRSQFVDGFLLAAEKRVFFQMGDEWFTASLMELVQPGVCKSRRKQIVLQIGSAENFPKCNPEGLPKVEIPLALAQYVFMIRMAVKQRLYWRGVLSALVTKKNRESMALALVPFVFPKKSAGK